MTNLYRVKLAVLTKNTVKKTGKPYGRPEWSQDSTDLNVLANGDAMKAVRKAFRHTVGKSFIWDDESGKKFVNTTLKARLIEVEKINSVDVR